MVKTKRGSMEKVFTRWLVMGVWSVSMLVGGIFPISGRAEDTSFQALDAEAEEVLNDVVSLGVDMAILEESREMTPENQLLVMVSVDPSPFFKLEAVELKLDDRTVSYHQYSDEDVEAMFHGGSHRLFWDDVPTGRHQVSMTLFGRVPGDPDFQRVATRMISTGSGRRVMELRVSSGRSQAFPEVNLKEWK